jgi:hypothetical protein
MAAAKQYYTPYRVILWYYNRKKQAGQQLFLRFPTFMQTFAKKRGFSGKKNAMARDPPAIAVFL